MSPSLYDDPKFFNGYAQLGRSKHGLADAPEWPAVAEVLPSLKDAEVLDLGCGYGWFCREARKRGAKRVLGIDVSQKMLDRASEMTRDDAIQYEQGDLEEVVLEQDAYDLIYCSLVLHYIVDFAKLAEKIQSALKPGGYFNFTIEHPLYTAPKGSHWISVDEEHKIWPLDDYLLEGERRTNWIVEGVVKQHRALATYVNTLVEAGLGVRKLV